MGDTDTEGVTDRDGEKETERLSDGKEEVKTKKIEVNKESDNVSELGKETQAVENREEEKKMDEDNGYSIDSENGEKGKESPGDDKAMADEKEKGTDEARKPPLPGGLLFGTFFNYMGGDQNSDDKGINEKESEDVGSAEDDKKRSKDKMETQ